MTLNELLDLFDNHNVNVVVNNNNLELYARVKCDKLYGNYLNYKAILDLPVIAFGFYDEELTVRLDFEADTNEPETQKTPCDYPDDDGYYHCPYDARGSDDCRRFCGLGVDE